jgi:CBS domain-containing protein
VREVDIVEASESVQAAAQRMHSRKVGTLVVQDESRRPIGIVTDRDLTVRAAAGRDPFQTTIGDVMTRARGRSTKTARWKKR